MATIVTQRGESLKVGVFDSTQRAASVVDRFLDAGLPAASIGLLMSDRTAERHLGPPNARQVLGLRGLYSPAFHRLALDLSPMAALGTMGSGLVGAGPLASALLEGGLGSRAGLEQALVHLGTPPEQARDATRHVRNGAVLVAAVIAGADDERRWGALIEHESALALTLAAPHHLSNTSLVSRAEAPSGGQRARYEPLIEGDSAPASSI